jgi:trimethylamine--corrinoid protein Co-methyltransferase
LKPNLTFLSKEAKDKINQAALQILAEIGMLILHDEALAILKDAGCDVDSDHLVKIPESLVHQCLDSAPDNISVYDRLGNPLFMTVLAIRPWNSAGTARILGRDRI